MKVLILGPKARYDAYAPDFLSQLPVESVFCPIDRSPLQAATDNPDTQALLVDAIPPVDARLMDLLPQLKLIHSEGVAFDKIDLAAARARGIDVCNNKGCNAGAVAEQAILLMLMLLRRALEGDRAVRQGRQMEMKERSMVEGITELSACRIGLVGFGDIAQATAARLAPFGCTLCYYAPHRRSPEEEARWGVTYLPLEELAASCDIVSLHCAVTDRTRSMVDEAFLDRMKPTSYLINTSRGELVDNQALRRALVEGRIAGAGFDTLAPEPVSADHPLVDLPPEIQDRVVFSPHLGGITEGAFRRSHLHMWRNAERVAAGEKPDNIVN